MKFNWLNNSEKPNIHPIILVMDWTDDSTCPQLPKLFPERLWSLPRCPQLRLVPLLFLCPVVVGLDGCDYRNLYCQCDLRLCCSPWKYVNVDLFYIYHIRLKSFVKYKGLGSSEAGLIISAAMSMARFQYGIRQSAEMVNQMTSVDRVIEYGKISPEVQHKSSAGYLFKIIPFFH